VKRLHEFTEFVIDHLQFHYGKFQIVPNRILSNPSLFFTADITFHTFPLSDECSQSITSDGGGLGEGNLGEKGVGIVRKVGKEGMGIRERGRNRKK